MDELNSHFICLKKSASVIVIRPPALPISKAILPYEAAPVL